MTYVELPDIHCWRSILVDERKVIQMKI